MTLNNRDMKEEAVKYWKAFIASIERMPVENFTPTERANLVTLLKELKKIQAYSSETFLIQLLSALQFCFYDHVVKEKYGDLEKCINTLNTDSKNNDYERLLGLALKVLLEQRVIDETNFSANSLRVAKEIIIPTDQENIFQNIFGTSYIEPSTRVASQNSASSIELSPATNDSIASDETRLSDQSDEIGIKESSSANVSQLEAIMKALNTEFDSIVITDNSENTIKEVSPSESSASTVEQNPKASATDNYDSTVDQNGFDEIIKNSGSTEPPVPPQQKSNDLFQPNQEPVTETRMDIKSPNRAIFDKTYSNWALGVNAFLESKDRESHDTTKIKIIYRLNEIYKQFENHAHVINWGDSRDGGDLLKYMATSTNYLLKIMREKNFKFSDVKPRAEAELWEIAANQENEGEGLTITLGLVNILAKLNGISDQEERIKYLNNILTNEQSIERTMLTSGEDEGQNILSKLADLRAEEMSVLQTQEIATQASEYVTERVKALTLIVDKFASAIEGVDETSSTWQNNDTLREVCKQMRDFISQAYTDKDQICAHDGSGPFLVQLNKVVDYLSNQIKAMPSIPAQDEQLDDIKKLELKLWEQAARQKDDSLGRARVFEIVTMLDELSKRNELPDKLMYIDSVLENPKKSLTSHHKLFNIIPSQVRGEGTDTTVIKVLNELRDGINNKINEIMSTPIDWEYEALDALEKTLSSKESINTAIRGSGFLRIDEKYVDLDGYTEDKTTGQLVNIAKGETPAFSEDGELINDSGYKLSNSIRFSSDIMSKEYLLKNAENLSTRERLVLASVITHGVGEKLASLAHNKARLLNIEHDRLSARLNNTNDKLSDDERLKVHARLDEIDAERRSFKEKEKNTIQAVMERVFPNSSDHLLTNPTSFEIVDELKKRISAAKNEFANEQTKQSTQVASLVEKIEAMAKNYSQLKGGTGTHSKDLEKLVAAAKEIQNNKKDYKSGYDKTDAIMKLMIDEYYKQQRKYSRPSDFVNMLNKKRNYDYPRLLGLVLREANEDYLFPSQIISSQVNKLNVGRIETPFAYAVIRPMRPDDIYQQARKELKDVDPRVVYLASRGHSDFIEKSAVVLKLWPQLAKIFSEDQLTEFLQQSAKFLAEANAYSQTLQNDINQFPVFKNVMDMVKRNLLARQRAFSVEKINDATGQYQIKVPDDLLGRKMSKDIYVDEGDLVSMITPVLTKVAEQVGQVKNYSTGQTPELSQQGIDPVIQNPAHIDSTTEEPAPAEQASAPIPPLPSIGECEEVFLTSLEETLCNKEKLNEVIKDGYSNLVDTAGTPVDLSGDAEEAFSREGEFIQDNPKKLKINTPAGISLAHMNEKYGLAFANINHLSTRERIVLTAAITQARLTLKSQLDPHREAIVSLIANNADNPEKIADLEKRLYHLQTFEAEVAKRILPKIFSEPYTRLLVDPCGYEIKEFIRTRISKIKSEIKSEISYEAETSRVAELVSSAENTYQKLKHGKETKHTQTFQALSDEIKSLVANENNSAENRLFSSVVKLVTAFKKEAQAFCKPFLHIGAAKSMDNFIEKLNTSKEFDYPRLLATVIKNILANPANTHIVAELRKHSDRSLNDICNKIGQIQPRNLDYVRLTVPADQRDNFNATVQELERQGLREDEIFKLYNSTNIGETLSNTIVYQESEAHINEAIAEIGISDENPASKTMLEPNALAEISTLIGNLKLMSQPIPQNNERQIEIPKAPTL